jgi:hypothetical protein
MGCRPLPPLNRNFLTADKKRIGTGEPIELYLRLINVSSTGIESAPVRVAKFKDVDRG